MKKSIFTSALLISAILMASCMKETELDNNKVLASEVPVGVMISGLDYTETRGSIATEANISGAFKIYAFQKTSGGIYSDHLMSGGVTANLDAAHTGTRVATFTSGPYFWPVKNNLDFYAIYPSSWGSSAVRNLTTPYTPKVTAAYTVETKMSDQKDLLYAHQPNATKGTTGNVSILFQHALSRVTFQGKIIRSTANTIQEAYIKKIVIKNAPTTGVFSYTTATDGVWTNTASVNVSSDQELKILSTLTPISEAAPHIGSFFMIPSATSTAYPLSGVTLDVTIYWAKNEAGSTYENVPLPTQATSWIAGNWYNYTLTLDAEKETISVGGVSVMQWGTISKGEVQVN